MIREVFGFYSRIWTWVWTLFEIQTLAVCMGGALAMGGIVNMDKFLLLPEAWVLLSLLIKM